MAPGANWRRQSLRPPWPSGKVHGAPGLARQPALWVNLTVSLTLGSTQGLQVFAVWLLGEGVEFLDQGAALGACVYVCICSPPHARFNGGHIANKCSKGHAHIVSASGRSVCHCIVSVPRPKWICSKDTSGWRVRHVSHTLAQCCH